MRVSHLLSFIVVVDAYKVLVYNPIFSHSHSSFMSKLEDLLADAGHQVSSLVSILDPALANGLEKSRKFYVQQGPATKALIEAYAETAMNLVAINMYNPIDGYKVSYFYGSLFSTQCAHLLEKSELIEKLKAERFDLFITEHFDMCGVGLVELIRPSSFISVSTTIPFATQLEEFGIPDLPSFCPSPLSPTMDVHSIWDRLQNLYAHFLLRVEFRNYRELVHAEFRARFGSDFPSFHSISSRSAYVFANTEPLIDFATPTLAKVIPVGGITISEPQPLSKKWFNIMGKRPRNVLLSFGSVVRSASLPLSHRIAIIETVRAIADVTFIWKYESIGDGFACNYTAKVDNLILTKWMPQTDLLAHPNMSLFITHGGMGSILEVASRGVPGVYVPFFGDQPRNAGMMQFNGLGKVFDKTDLGNTPMFTAAIREVLDNESYRINAQRMKQLIESKPFSAKDQVVKYAEFSAAYGASKALRPASYDMNWIQYYNLDVTLLLISFLSAIVIAVRRIYGKLDRKVKKD